ncbi:hypothetical protein [Aquimarina algiphila]|uniref:Uncharacterized protein n=1 Tax=Aquimarina algiphila TaxID=2047982 RepID=A0A554VAT3_9FLAO|nr:hypothetical protein [Aquimarina algiphila]TSE03396.1 hypothetical protein FOF46_29455 [Aquimarina algiphila]
MNNFKDFNIKPRVINFTGDKIPIKRVFNIPIQVLDYKIENSKHKENTKCLTLQIEKDNEKRIIFTGSTILIQQIESVPKDRFPFETTIVNDNEYFEFT